MKQQEEQTLIRQKTIKIQNKKKRISIDLPAASRNNDKLEELKNKEQNTVNVESTNKIDKKDNFYVAEDQETQEKQK